MLAIHGSQTFLRSKTGWRFYVAGADGAVERCPLFDSSCREMPLVGPELPMHSVGQCEARRCALARSSTSSNSGLVVMSNLHPCRTFPCRVTGVTWASV